MYIVVRNSQTFYEERILEISLTAFTHIGSHVILQYFAASSAITMNFNISANISKYMPLSADTSFVPSDLQKSLLNINGFPIYNSNSQTMAKQQDRLIKEWNVFYRFTCYSHTQINFDSKKYLKKGIFHIQIFELIQVLLYYLS